MNCYSTSHTVDIYSKILAPSNASRCYTETNVTQPKMSLKTIMKIMKLYK